MRKRILIVDDEPNIIELIRMNLPTGEFEVLPAWDGNTALEVARSEQPHLILLDIMLPDLDGFEVLRILRADPITEHIPVLLLTARSEEPDKVIGLGLGADDYITKPFGLRELEARVRNALRRSDPARRQHAAEAHDVAVLDLLLDQDRRLVVRRDVVGDLTPNEFAILQQLARNQGKTVSRQALLSCISRSSSDTDERVIDVHIRNIRRKLGDQNESPRYIETVRGAGYRMKQAVR
ncbi:MAG: DNA-binding response regulator [Spirochaetaceae bacterium]|nr:MAG: DNA-binding response regulator [Spirochaetaceae bacterium]